MMRDFQFGNFLRQVRIQRGLTQYQLGALVGVSDKAVSKWERGLSKPQSCILFRIGEILGIHVDELLSCQYRSTKEPNRKGIYAMKKQLWNKAFDRMKERFGGNVPVEVLNRFLSEYTEMQHTDIIVYLDMLALIRNEAEKRGEHIRVTGSIGASFVAYILGATEIDPLKPHYECPHCRCVEFADGVSDGWDLPIKKCKCGTEMICEGHDIPFQVYMSELHRSPYFDLIVSPEFMDKAQEFVLFYFCDSDMDHLLKKDNPDFAAIVLIPNKGEKPREEEELSKLRLNYPSVTLCEDPHMSAYRMLEEVTGTSFRRIRFREKEVLDHFKSGNTDGVPVYGKDFLKNMMREISASSYHDVIQISGLANGSGTWIDNGQQLFAAGVPLSDLIAYREDVFAKIQKNMLKKHLFDMGFAYKVMNDTRRGVYARGGVSEEMKRQFCEIGMEDWFSGSIEKIKYLFPKAHGVLYAKYALILMWYKIHYPKEFCEVISC